MIDFATRLEQRMLKVNIANPWAAIVKGPDAPDLGALAKMREDLDYFVATMDGLPVLLANSLQLRYEAV